MHRYIAAAQVGVCIYVGKTTLVTAHPFYPPRRGGGAFLHTNQYGRLACMCNLVFQAIQ